MKEDFALLMLSLSSDHRHREAFEVSVVLSKPIGLSADVKIISSDPKQDLRFHIALSTSIEGYVAS